MEKKDPETPKLERELIEMRRTVDSFNAERQHFREEIAQLEGEKQQLANELNRNSSDYELLNAKISSIIEECENKLSNMDRYIKEEEARFRANLTQKTEENKRILAEASIWKKEADSAQDRLEQAESYIEESEKIKA